MKQLLIGGTHSGCGKTTITCAILQALVNRGMDVTSFKCGPDYIDPMFHRKILGTQARNLDGFFCTKETLQQQLCHASGSIAVVEGVMGYYDGIKNKASSYHLAVDLKLPSVLVIDCKGMSASIGAIMKGFLTFRQPNPIVGFIFNRLPESLVEQARAFCEEMQVSYFGRFPYAKACSIESRHLGLVTANEIADLQQKTNQLAAMAEEHLDLDGILAAATESVCTPVPQITIPCTQKPVRIAVACDDAFCFYYEENLELLKQLGCELLPFSPINDAALPDQVSGLLLGGGYPELFAERLSENKRMRRSLYEHICNGLPTIAECGGFLYLHKTLETSQGTQYNMVGLLAGTAYPTPRLQRFGYVYLTSKTDTLLLKTGEQVPAHEFHYWDSTTCGTSFTAEKASTGVTYDCIHASDTLYAGFPHLYFYAKPELAVRFLKKAKEYQAHHE